MARKRAPGGGRKPIRSSAARAQLSVRMPDDLRTELEEAAARRGHSLTQEMLGRLKESLDRERVDRRDEPMRALCFLFQALAQGVSFGWANPPLARRHWHSDPFTFEAFKRAIPQVLDALRPSGEVISPSAAISAETLQANPVLSFWAEGFKTPESAAAHAVRAVLENLFRPKVLTAEDEKEIRRANERGAHPNRHDWTEAFIAELKRNYFAMDKAGRALGVRQSPHLSIAKAWEDLGAGKAWDHVIERHERKVTKK